MTVEPMTDASLAAITRLKQRGAWSSVLESIRLRFERDAATIAALTAERDAAVAREAEREADADGWFLRAVAAIGKLPEEIRIGDLQDAYAEAEERLLPKPRLMRTVEEVAAPCRVREKFTEDLRAIAAEMEAKDA